MEAFIAGFSIIYISAAVITFIVYTLEDEAFPDAVVRGVLWPAYSIRAIVRIVKRDFFGGSDHD